MNISEKNFLKDSFNFKRYVNGEMETVPRYSYESKKKLYDVYDIDDVRYYRINGTSSDKTFYHLAIERFFNLED